MASRCCSESSSATTSSFDTDDIEDSTERIAYISSSFFGFLLALSSANTVANLSVDIVDAKGNDRRRSQFYTANRMYLFQLVHFTGSLIYVLD